MKIVTIVGARPQFVKAAVVSRAFADVQLDEVVVHTGQHYDAAMSDVFFGELGIPRPTHSLGIGSGSHGAQTGRMLEAIEKVLSDEQPNLVVVYGDTNSTLAGALAAAKLHFPVAHIEAGLRSFNRRMPEEVNRVMTDHLASLLYAPTDDAVSHLSSEGIAGCHVCQSGDVMFDATLTFGEIASARSQILSSLGVQPGDYVLATVHRAENTDSPERLGVIIDSLSQLAEEIPVVFPVHPRTRTVIGSEFQRRAVPKKGLHLIDPVGYLDMIALEKSARAIATDSGGVQKESFFFRVPCVTLRTETEWTELVSLGWNTVVPPESSAQVIAALRRAVAGFTGKEAAPYGNGDASSVIAKHIAAWHCAQT